MNSINKYFSSLKKDFRLVFRSWQTIFLVIIGPLLLMLILMFAFSNVGFSNMNIGYSVDQDSQKYQDFLPNIGYLGNFIEYNNINLCDQDLKRQKLHLCLDLQSDELAVHFDNTREVLSLILINQIRSAIIIEKDQLIKDKATDLLGETSDFQGKLREGEDFISSAIEDINDQKYALQDTKRDLQEAQDRILTRIDQVERVKSTIVKINNNHLNDLSVNIRSVLNSLDEVDDALNIARDFAIATNDWQTVDEIDAQKQSINALRWSIDDDYSNIQSLNYQVDNLITQIDLVLDDLNFSNDFLHENQIKIKKAIDVMDNRADDLRDIKRDLKSNRNKLKVYGINNVDDFITPLEVSYEPMYLSSERFEYIKGNVEVSIELKKRAANFATTQTLLPLMILLLISFVATILSNIILLDELHSKAYLRNLILPTSWFTRNLSIFSTIFSITMVQVLIMVGIGYIVYFLDLANGLLAILISMSLIIAIYSIIGFIFAYLIRSKTTSLLVSSFFLIINLLLGGVFYPVERMAPFMSNLAAIIPFSSGISIIQQSVFYGVNIFELTGKIFSLVLILVVCIIILCIARKINQNRFKKGN